MNRKLLIIVFLFLSINLFSKTSESNTKNNFIFLDNHIFSFDLNYLTLGIKNNGWGLGVSYERKITEFAAAKINFSHCTVNPFQIDSTVTTVGLKITPLIYPFNKGLNFLYFGCEGSTDFLMISNADKSYSIIGISPIVGFKQSFLELFLIDLFCGYKFIIKDDISAKTPFNEQGFTYGIKFKINLEKLFKKIFHKSK